MFVMKALYKKIEKKVYDYYLEQGVIHGNDIDDLIKSQKIIIFSNDSNNKKNLLKNISLKSKLLRMSLIALALWWL